MPTVGRDILNREVRETAEQRPGGDEGASHMAPRGGDPSGESAWHVRHVASAATVV